MNPLLLSGGFGSSGAGAMSNFVKNMSAKKVEVVQEYDDVPREAEVYLYIKPIEMFPNAQNEMFMHWTWVFKFVDGSVRTAEGVQEDDQSLQGYYGKESPQQTEKGRYHPMGTITISPKQLREVTNANNCNGKSYCPTLMNCHDWAIDLAKKLGGDILQKIREFKTLKNTGPGLAYIVSSVNGTCRSVKNFSS